MPAPAQTLQTAQPALGTVTRQPQTTADPATSGAPFHRLARKAQQQGPSSAGNAYGAFLTPILKPVGGYLRGLYVYLTAGGGVGGGATVAAAADAPYSVAQSILLRDPFGQPIYQADGYSGYLIMLYGGQAGALGFGNNPATLPSFSALATGVGASGNYTFRLEIPIEFDSSGYCALPSMNASSQPQLQIGLSPAGAVYTTAPATTVPTLTVTVDEPYWSAPVDSPGLAPPDVGSSAQWTTTQAAATIPSASFSRVQLTPGRNFLHTLILVLRDSLGARVDAWPTADLALWLDGVPYLMESSAERFDAMFRQFGVTRPTGVLVYSFRDSVQQFVSSADTHDTHVPTTPGTLIELSGTFGVIANAPAKITVVSGWLYPYSGIPYGHLAE